MHKIIKSSDFISTQWSGGITNQMYITPSDTSIVNQDFLVRISTATINTLTSEFTKFPFHNRFLSVLDGEIEFITQNQPVKKITEYEFVFFDGASITRSNSTSKVVDFNIIFKKSLQLNLQCVKGSETNNLNFNSIKEKFIFVLNGTIIFNQITLNKHELLILENIKESILLELSKDAIIFFFDLTTTHSTN